MTTIAALAHGDGHVYMAADSQTNVYDRPIYTARKIRRLLADNRDVLIGVSGDGGLGDLLEANLKIDGTPDGDEWQPWAAAVAHGITEIATTAGLVDNGRLDGSLLLGCAGHLWSLTHGQAIRLERYGALGSGEGVAIGVMDALDGTMQPDALVQRAVVTAARYNAYTGGPVHVEVT